MGKHEIGVKIGLNSSILDFVFEKNGLFDESVFGTRIFDSNRSAVLTWPNLNTNKT